MRWLCGKRRSRQETTGILGQAPDKTAEDTRPGYPRRDGGRR